MFNRLFPMTIAILAVMQVVCNKQSMDPDETEPMDPVEWIQSNAVPVFSLDPSNEDFTDLAPLINAIGSARIVMLGEQSHGDGNTFLAKTRLIKFLHRLMEFNVLAFESNLYDCWKANTLLKQGMNPYEAFRKGIFTIWSESQQVQPLIAYLGETQNSADPIELAGFDIQFTHPASQEYFIDDLIAFMTSNGLDTAAYAHWSQFKQIFTDLSKRQYFYADPPDSVTQSRFFDTLEQIQADIAAKPANFDEISLWSQILLSLNVFATKTWNYDWEDPGGTNKNVLNMRDIQMGNNLIWLLENMYPGKKIIVWAATLHIVHHLEDVSLSYGRRYYRGYVTMGDIVWDRLGNQTYALGFTAFRGSYGRANDSGITTLYPPSQGSLEDLIHTAGIENAIIDFRSVGNDGAFLKATLTCRPMGYTEMIAVWTEIMDGIMYTETMIPSTPINGIQN